MLILDRSCVPIMCGLRRKGPGRVTTATSNEIDVDTPLARGRNLSSTK